MPGPGETLAREFARDVGRLRCSEHLRQPANLLARPADLGLRVDDGGDHQRGFHRVVGRLEEVAEGICELRLHGPAQLFGLDVLSRCGMKVRRSKPSMQCGR